MKKANSSLILNGNLKKVILSLSIPIVMNSFIQTLYNLTDTYWLGKIGTDPMTAITIVSPVQSIVISFGQGITAAGAILISQYVGAKAYKEAKDMLNHLFISAMIFSIVCSLSSFLFTPAIVNWLGAEGEINLFSRQYLQIVLLDMPFLFMLNLYTAVNQAQGDTVKPMLLNLCGVILNMFLDPLFMMVFHWGIVGAASATLLAKVPCAIFAFISIRNTKNDIYLKLSEFKFDKKKLNSIIKIGLPTALGGSTMQFGFLLMAREVYKYGSIATAAYGIGNKVNGLITLPSNAMGSATATIVGQNMGAVQVDRAEEAYKIARRYSVIFLFIGGIILSREFIAQPIVSIFSNDPEVIILGTEFLSILALYCWTNGIYNTTTGLFQGTGHTLITMVNDATRLWGFRFLTLFICESVLDMGVQSIWYSVVISNAISAFILYVLYKFKLWKKNKVKL